MDAGFDNKLSHASIKLGELRKVQCWLVAIDDGLVQRSVLKSRDPSARGSMILVGAHSQEYVKNVR
jgi:hypothetical protein